MLSFGCSNLNTARCAHPGRLRSPRPSILEITQHDLPITIPTEKSAASHELCRIGPGSVRVTMNVAAKCFGFHRRILWTRPAWHVVRCEHDSGSRLT